MSGGTVYSRAADIIREQGWWDGTRSTSVNERGGQTRCLRQSLKDAAVEMRLSQVDTFSPVYPKLGGKQSARPDPVAGWNDAPERTVEDVLLLLKELHVEAGGS